MKKNNNNAGNNASPWIEEVLNSLDGAERARANPFLYTRIAARLEKKNTTWEKAAYWLGKPVFAVATISIFLAINISVIMWDQKQSSEAMALQKTSEQLLASEFTNTQSYQLVDINEEK